MKQSIRLKNYDYSNDGLYFITICTFNKENYFGEIENNKLQKTIIGKIAEKFLIEIPIHFPFVIVDEFVVMPNHIHVILLIDKCMNVTGTDIATGTDVVCRDVACNVPTNNDSTKINTAKNSPSQNALTELRYNSDQLKIERLNNYKGKYPIQSLISPYKYTLSSIIRSYKSAVTNQANQLKQNFKWQRNYYESIIKTTSDYEKIANYINNNIINWQNNVATGRDVATGTGVATGTDVACNVLQTTIIK